MKIALFSGTHEGPTGAKSGNMELLTPGASGNTTGGCFVTIGGFGTMGGLPTGGESGMCSLGLFAPALLTASTFWKSALHAEVPLRSVWQRMAAALTASASALPLDEATNPAPTARTRYHTRIVAPTATLLNASTSRCCSRMSVATLNAPDEAAKSCAILGNVRDIQSQCVARERFCTFKLDDERNQPVAAVGR